MRLESLDLDTTSDPRVFLHIFNWVCLRLQWTVSMVRKFLHQRAAQPPTINKLDKPQLLSAVLLFLRTGGKSSSEERGHRGW